MTARGSPGWFDRVILDLGRQMRWSFLPPLMVYFSAGVAGLTAIVGTFFVKDYLGLSAAFLAGIAFWAGLPWALKMPLGHLVDLIWRWKAVLVYLGAGLVTLSLAIMYLLITDPDMMATIMPHEAWFVISALLSPVGFVVQDAVADAMSVEAVPRVDAHGQPLSEASEKAMHTTMQTLGRFALISGTVAVAVLNIAMFAGVEDLSQPEKIEIYARIYLIALIVPVLSISGVLLATWQSRLARARLVRRGMTAHAARTAQERPEAHTQINHWYFTGGAVFVVLSLAIGLSDVAMAQEIVFAGSMAIVLFLIRQLIANLPAHKAFALIGTAAIIFVFRAMPGPGAASTWFVIDELGFDEQFLSLLSLIVSVLTLAGIIALRPLMARWSMARIIVLLTLAGAVLSLPNIGLYYGVHHWTAAHTGGIVDARFIAILDTAVESPLGQVAMIPMLAWIARNAPENLKATFFAVMASFTNLALSSSALGTKYLNQIFLVTREVTDRTTGDIQVVADYSQLGGLLITVAVLGLVVPLLAVALVQRSRLKTRE